MPGQRPNPPPPLPLRYIISYDLDNSFLRDKDYQKLEAIMKGLSGERVLLSQWVVRVPGTTASKLRSLIVERPWFHPVDRLLVTCLDSADWAAFNTMTDLHTFQELHSLY